MIKNSSSCSNKNVNSSSESMSLSFNWNTTVNGNNFEFVVMIFHLGQLIGDLDGKLSGWCKHDGLEFTLAKEVVFSQSFNDWKTKGKGLS